MLRPVLSRIVKIDQTRPGVDWVKPKGWFKYSLQIDKGLVWDWSNLVSAQGPLVLGLGLKGLGPGLDNIGPSGVTGK